MAAKKVYLTQPTVSGHIKGLEDELGVKLFDRTGKQVTPTKAGEVLLPYAREIMHLATQAKEDLLVFLGGGRGTLSLGGSNIPGQYILPDLIGRFKAGRPGIRVTLHIGDTSDIAEAVETGDLELGMVGGMVRKGGLVFEPCFDDELVLIVPPGHPLASRQTVDLDALRTEPFVVREPGSGTRMAVERAFKEAGLHGDAIEVVAEMGSTEAVRQAVKAGLGLAFISRRAVAEDVGHGVLHTVALKGADFRRRFYLVTNKKRTMSPLAHDFLALVQRIALGAVLEKA